MDIRSFLALSHELLASAVGLLPKNTRSAVVERPDHVRIDVRDPSDMRDIASLSVHLKPKNDDGGLYYAIEATLTASICSADMDTAVDSIVVLRDAARLIRGHFSDTKVIVR